MMTAEANDVAGENVHNQHHPMAAWQDRFAAEENDAPEAIFRVGDECQPGETRGAGVVWSVVPGEDSTNHIFVDLHAEGMRDLLGDPVLYERGFS